MAKEIKNNTLNGSHKIWAYVILVLGIMLILSNLATTPIKLKVDCVMDKPSQNFGTNTHRYNSTTWGTGWNSTSEISDFTKYPMPNTCNFDVTVPFMAAIPIIDRLG